MPDDKLTNHFLHIMAMSNDTYLSGHPEWPEIVRETSELMDGPNQMALVLTPEEVDAFGDLLQLAHDDQEEYLTGGWPSNPEADYGAEWPEAAARKRVMFIHAAAIASKLKLQGIADQFKALAEADILKPSRNG